MNTKNTNMNTKHTSITSPVELLQPKLPPRRRVRTVGIRKPGEKTKRVRMVDEEPAPTVLRELIESPAFSDPANIIPLALGEQEDGSFLIPDLVSLPHLLVAGKNAGEVDYAWRTLMLSLLLRRRDEKVVIEVLCCGAEKEPLGEFVTILQKRAKEATDRLRFFAMTGVAGMEAFNSRNPETQVHSESAKFLPERMMRRVIVLHNLGELIQVEPEKTLDALTKLCKATSLSRLAPSDAGIHLIITCDEPTKENLPDELLKLIPARMVFRTPSSKRLLPGMPAGQKRLRDGEFRYRAHEDASCLTAMLPISTPEEVDAVLEYRMSKQAQV